MDMIGHSLGDSENKEYKEEIMAHSLSIVEDEGSLGSNDEHAGTQEIVNGHQTLLDTGEEDITYQFHSNEGVTYRVVHVQRTDNVETVPIPAVNYTNNTMPQALISNPLNGQLYVIGSPQEVFQTTTNRSVATRTNIQIDNTRVVKSKRDDRRRATHNEVERRRRDKINTWIMNLSKIIPDCNTESSKGGSFETQSKGYILSKACDYISLLKETNTRLQGIATENETLVNEIEILNRQLEELKGENEQLRTQLAENGIFNPSCDPLA